MLTRWSASGIVLWLYGNAGLCEQRLRLVAWLCPPPAATYLPASYKSWQALRSRAATYSCAECWLTDVPYESRSEM